MFKEYYNAVCKAANNLIINSSKNDIESIGKYGLDIGMIFNIQPNSLLTIVPAETEYYNIYIVAVSDGSSMYTKDVVYHGKITHFIFYPVTSIRLINPSIFAVQFVSSMFHAFKDVVNRSEIDKYIFDIFTTVATVDIVYNILKFHVDPVMFIKYHVLYCKTPYDCNSKLASSLVKIVTTVIEQTSNIKSGDYITYLFDDSYIYSYIDASESAINDDKLDGVSYLKISG